MADLMEEFDNAVRAADLGSALIILADVNRAVAAAAVLAEREAIAAVLHGRGDSAYVRGYELSKRDLCLGEEAKIASGTFTLANLKALEETRAQFGGADALWEAEKVIRARSGEKGAGNG